MFPALPDRLPNRMSVAVNPGRLARMQMQRPVMNPTFYDEQPGAGPSRRFKLLRLLAATGLRAVRLVFMLLTYDPFANVAGFRNEEGTRVSRTIRGFMYRLAFVPVIIA